MKKTCVWVAMVAAFVAGCGGEGIDPDSIDEPELEIEGVSLNGASLNGVSLNGVSLNGVSLNGVSLNGVSLNGVSLNGVSLNGVSLNGTDFAGTSPTGPVTGAAFVGTKWTGTLSNGSTLNLKIDSRSALPAPNADVFAYAVSYQTTTGWSALCGKDAQLNPILAIPQKGTWNYGQGVPGGGSFTADSAKITFGCRGTAIAKCIELGYKPWKLVPGSTTTTLQNHQVACTRMLRADYCGDGTPNTVTGTQINLYDGVGIQTDTQAWNVEAEWTAAGARYISPQNDVRYNLLGKQKPACFAAKVSYTAGTLSHFSTGTLLIDEYQAQ